MAPETTALETLGQHRARTGHVIVRWFGFEELLARDAQYYGRPIQDGDVMGKAGSGTCATCCALIR